jgi:hypothetical protein
LIIAGESRKPGFTSCYNRSIANELTAARQMKMPDHELALRQSSEHIEAWERAVAHQINVLIQLRADGHPTQATQQLLDSMREALETMKRHHRLIQAEIQQERCAGSD